MKQPTIEEIQTIIGALARLAGSLQNQADLDPTIHAAASELQTALTPFVSGS